jgi:Fic family protein
MYTPPFTLTPRIFALSQNISHVLGVLEGRRLDAESIKLRRENSIKTIYSSLAIEGNTLSVEQVTHIFEGKRVLGPQRDIIEVQNALAVYERFDTLKPTSRKDLLNTHKMLMKNLIPENGVWRTGNVGVFKGDQLAHMAPPAKRVPLLMKDLFTFLNKNKEASWLLKACIFHYELEFIHPFMDGNGRMGRLWQQLLLAQGNPIFKFITVEELIKKNQKEYYNVLSQCDKEGNSIKFIEFSLNLIHIALKIYEKEPSLRLNDTSSRLEYARRSLKNLWFSRKDYMAIFKDISSATASRDLKQGINAGFLDHKGSHNKVRYFYRSNKDSTETLPPDGI